MEVQMIRGPQDGRTLDVPDNCRELRFPMSLDPGLIRQFRDVQVDLTALELPVAIYRRTEGPYFLYDGQA
jgi:hypothetical protein